MHAPAAKHPTTRRWELPVFFFALIALVGLQQASLLPSDTRMQGHFTNGLHFPMFWLLTVLLIRLLRRLPVGAPVRFAASAMLLLAAGTEFAQRYGSGTPSLWDFTIDLMAISGAICWTIYGGRNAMSTASGRLGALALNAVFLNIAMLPFGLWRYQYLRLELNENYLIPPDQSLMATFLRCGCRDGGIRWLDSNGPTSVELTYRPAQWPGLMFIDLPRDRLQRGPLLMAVEASSNIERLRVSLRNRTPGRERVELPGLTLGTGGEVRIDTSAMARLPASRYLDLIFEFDAAQISPGPTRLVLSAPRFASAQQVLP